MRLLCGALALVLGMPMAAAAQHADGTASTTGRFTLLLLDVPLVQALETLARETRINLVWQAATLGDRASARVSCRLEQVPPETALACVTRAAGVDYVRLSSGTYVVVGGAEQPAAWGALVGRVVDEATGAPLPQARVQLAEGPASVLSSDDGGFTFPRLRPGRYQVQVRAVGYRPYRTSLELLPEGSRLLRLSLTRTEVAARPIVVNGLRAGALSGALGATTLADSVVRRTLVGPALFLPGAVAPLGLSRRDGTGDLHLQGGDVGEHPWRLDGMPLYDVTALSGLLGVVSPLALDELTVRRSGYRARDGSFATGVIDLRHAAGASDAPPRAEVEADPIAVAARVSTPLSVGAARGSVALTGRSGLWQYTAPTALTRALRHWSVPDPVLLSRLNDFGNAPGLTGIDAAAFQSSVGDERVRLHDLHAAARLELGLGQILDASSFSTQHGVAYTGAADDGAGNSLRTRDAYDKRSWGAQLSHQWLLGTRVRQTVQLRASQQALEHTGSMMMRTAGAAAPATPAADVLGAGAGEDYSLTELAARGEWRVQAAAGTEVVLGAELLHNDAHLNLANRVLRPLAYKTAVTRGALLADVSQQLRGNAFLDAGLRVTQLQNGRTYAEPRLAVRGERVRGARSLSWRVAGGGYHQFVNQFDVASTMPVAFVPSMRFWLPSDGRAPVAQAWHLAGEMAATPASGWEVRGELYARWHTVLPMFDYGVMFGAGATATPLWDAAEFVQASRGRAIGGGVRVLREASWLGVRTRSELAYDGGMAERRYPSRFGGALQPTPWLEPHRLLLSSELRPTRSVTVATRVRGVWGRPWALRQAYYDLFGAAPLTSPLPIDMPGRMTRPAVIDVDLGASWERPLAGAQIELGASVLNVIGRANVLDYGLRRVDEGRYTMVPRFMPARQLAVTLRVRY